MKSRVTYPDVSDILARKAAGRRQLASLSFGEKLDMLDALRERTEPLRRRRDEKRGAALGKSHLSAAKK
jgi:hypothetical protein